MTLLSFTSLDNPIQISPAVARDVAGGGCEEVNSCIEERENVSIVPSFFSRPPAGGSARVNWGPASGVGVDRRGPATGPSRRGTGAGDGAHARRPVQERHRPRHGDVRQGAG